MKIRKILLAATSLGAGVLCVPGMLSQAMAQDAGAEPQTIETIVVTGIRGSIAASATIKRDSKQFVDVITAEDVGKLPDNNVIEALAHVTGVQISRSHGEGSGISIRGMTDVATTLNGNSASVGESRSMDLSNIPAELLKSVTVYKTRSADQVEGGVAGTVNVDLRRPLDLPEGLTLAGSARLVNGSIGDTWSPYFSALVADRFQTGIGEMGFLVNLGYTQNSYNENYFSSETLAPASYYWNPIGSQQNTWYNNLSSSNQAMNGGYGPAVPYAVYYGKEQGVKTRPTLNVSTQWRYSDELDFVLEGSAFTSVDKTHRDMFKALTAMDTSFAWSNIVMQPNTGNYDIAKSFTYTGTMTTPSGPQSYYEKNNSSAFNTNFEAHWHHGRWAVNAAAQYNWSATKYHGYLSIFRFNDSSSGSIDLVSSKAAGNAYITFDNVDLTDKSEYDLYQYHDEKLLAKSQEAVGQVDATYRVSDDWYIRNIQFGSRFNTRHTTRNYGYRDAWFFPTGESWVNKGTPLTTSSFPCANGLEKVSLDMKSSPSWYRLSSKCIVDNEAAIRSYITANATTWYDWSTAEPPDVDLAQSYISNENSFAGYGQANWATNLYFPVDGQIGVRVVQTWGDATSTEYRYTATSTTITPHSADKNYTDTMPNANAVVHFTDKFQLRASYFYQIERPDFLSSSSWQVIDTSAKSIWSGNPDLKPKREHSYDASLEYFFGKGGQLSLTYYLKKPHGSFYYDYQTVTYNGDSYKHYELRNANPGNYEGLEFTAQSFFDFLPGMWANFGGKVNATLLTSYKILYPYTNADAAALSEAGDIYAADGTSRYTYNIELYYDTPQFSSRVSYNFREKYRNGIFTSYPGLSPWGAATSRLDAAVNYTPYKWMTVSLEGSNLLKETDRTNYGRQAYLPASARLAARTIQFSVRLRN